MSLQNLYKETKETYFSPIPVKYIVILIDPTEDDTKALENFVVRDLVTCNPINIEFRKSTDNIYYTYSAYLPQVFCHYIKSNLGHDRFIFAENQSVHFHV